MIDPACSTGEDPSDDAARELTRNLDRRSFIGGLGAAGLALTVGAKVLPDRRDPAGHGGRHHHHHHHGHRRHGPRNPDSAETVVYPPDTFAATTADAGVLDIKALFGAKGDGVTDDTDAFIRAYDLVISRHRDLPGSSPLANQNIIYLPDGTYLVNDTIIYSLQLVTNTQNSESLGRVRFQGQSRDGVVIRLTDNAPGYATGTAKPVLSLAKGTKNATPASNYVQNLTIDTGSGNPDAVGLLFAGANNAAVRHVTIRSGDGAGAVGLSLPVEATVGVYEDIEITGFDVAISAQPSRAFSIAVEDVQLSGQQVVGLRVGDSCVSVRNLVSSNSVPAAEITGADGQLVIVDSVLSDGASSVSAIDVQAGELFARNLHTSGYGAAITKGGSVVVGSADVDEYVSAPVSTLFTGQDPHSLDLPVQPIPQTPWPADLSGRTSVNSHGAAGDGVTDDSAAIQAAMDSGHPVVYFLPGHDYVIGSTVIIPASVRRVEFMFANLLPTGTMTEGDPLLAVHGAGSDDPLLLADLLGLYGGDEKNPVVDQASVRTLLIRNSHHQHAPMYRNSAPGGTLYLDSVSCRTAPSAPTIGLPGFVFTGQRVQARHLNAEYGQPNVVNHGSALSLLGGKTEGPWDSFVTEANGQTEILGAVVNVFTGGWTIPSDASIVGNDKSAVSATLATFGGGKYFETVVSETRATGTRTLRYDQVPRRLNSVQSFLPLYVGNAAGSAR